MAECIMSIGNCQLGLMSFYFFRTAKEAQEKPELDAKERTIKNLQRITISALVIKVHLLQSLSSALSIFNKQLCKSQTLSGSMRVCPSVGPSIGLLVHRLVGLSIGTSVHWFVCRWVHPSISLSIHNAFFFKCVFSTFEIARGRGRRGEG